MSKEFGKRLQKARLVEGLTQKELGAKIGVVQGAIFNWEKGLSAPKPELSDKLRSVLGELAEPGSASSAGGELAGNTPPAFGAWLKKARAEAEMSVPQLARASKLSVAAIYTSSQVLAPIRMRRRRSASNWR